MLDAVAGFPGLVVGWVAWTVEGEQLCSPEDAGSWPPGRPRIAACRTCRHVAPAAGCECGILATTELGLARLATRGSGRPAFVGLAAVWGRIESGPGPATGWRAKRGYPAMLIADARTTPALCRAVSAAYRVPVYRVDGDLEALFDDRDRRIVLQTVRCRLEELLRSDAPPRPGTAGSAVGDLVESVVSAWSAAEVWRHDRTQRLTAARTPPSTPVPDIAGVVVAWRSWQLAGSSLTSVTRPDSWPGAEPMVGRCAAGGHAVPHESCGCGVYAARAVDYAAQYHYAGTGASVMGCVALWGRLVEATFGWRAEKAYPTILFVSSAVPESTRASLSRRYRVPVHVMPDGGGRWSRPAITRTAETVRTTLERHHGRVSQPDVAAAVDALVAAARTGPGGRATPGPAPPAPAALPTVGRPLPATPAPPTLPAGPRGIRAARAVVLACAASLALVVTLVLVIA